MNPAAAYMELATGRVLFGAAPHTGFFVRGVVHQERFIPGGDAEGQGDLGDSGAPGWLELSDGSFHGDQTARPPSPPFIRGVKAPTGEFRPITPDIIR